MEQPPKGTDPKLSEYLIRQFNAVKASVADAVGLDILTALPDKPQIGKMYYFSVLISPWITYIGVWAYKLLTAGTFVTGQQYKILSPGTTNFTLIGAADNNVGTIFTATGPGTGNGTALTWSYLG